ncbi:hypothetical protein HK405_004916 [Cladochytrium tenue]|nr:hypothetical protein HK405_004916 [Cladochytrium tenue]
MPPHLPVTRLRGDFDAVLAPPGKVVASPAAPKLPLSSATTAGGGANGVVVATAPMHRTGGGTQDRSDSVASPGDPAAVLDLVQGVCHGRVASIEKMVPQQWWKTVFDAMYLRTDGDVVEDPEVTREEVGMLDRDPVIKNIFLKGTDRRQAAGKVLDLCCGQGRHLLHLAKQYPHLELFGHDQSSYLISLAQQRASDLRRNHRRPPVFTVGDCREVPFPSGTFDLVMVLGNSFGYFSSEDDDRAVLDEIHRVLVPGGVAIVDLTDGVYMRRHFVQRSWEWLDDGVFVCRERELSKDGLRLSTREVITSTTRGVLRDQFYQERLYSGDEVAGLARSAGFDLLARPSAASTDDSLAASSLTFANDLSKRQEDLGMMGHRMVVVIRKSASSNLPSSGTTTPRATADNDLTRLQTQLSVASLDHSVTSTAAPASMVPLNRGLSVVVPTEPRGSERPVFENLVLVLGDPSQACIGKLNNTWNAEDLATRQRLVDALSELGYCQRNLAVVERHASMYDQLRAMLQTGAASRPVVFNLCDEGFDNDALKELHVPALLEMLRVDYSGADPNCLAYCYDKGLVTCVAGAIGVPTPRETFLHGLLGAVGVDSDAAVFSRVRDRVGLPAFIKPVRGDNSLGITAGSLVRDEAGLRAKLSELRAQGVGDAAAQEYLAGTEYSVGVVGNPQTGFRFLPTLEVDFTRIVARGLVPILGFESKWDPTSPYWSEIGYRRAELSPEAERCLRADCVRLWERFGCRDYARFDWRCDRGKGDGKDGLGGTIKLLEVNPNPGWCWDGKLTYMAKLDGLEYKDVLRLILRAASDRIEVQGRSRKDEANA